MVSSALARATGVYRCAAAAVHNSANGSITQATFCEVEDATGGFQRRMQYTSSGLRSCTAYQADARISVASRNCCFRVKRRTGSDGTNRWACYEYGQYAHVPQAWVDNMNATFNSGDASEELNITKLATAYADKSRSLRPLCNVHVTKQAAGYREDTKLTPPTFLVPTVLKNSGNCVGEGLLHVLLGVSMREGNTEMQNRISIFKRLLENEWGDKMGRASLETLNLRKQNAEKQLPTTEDMKRLQNHLQTKLASTMESASRKPSVKSYNTLACVTAVSLMVFNKRRGGESMKIRVCDYTSRAAYTQNETVFNSLSDLEKQIMDKMCLIKTRGKRGRTVPVLIPQMEKRAIDLLVSLRESVGLRDSVPEEALLFSKAPEGRLVNGWYQLKKECKDAGCRDINAITSNKYAKK